MMVDLGSDVTGVNLSDSRLNPVLFPVHCCVIYSTTPEPKSHTLIVSVQTILARLYNSRRTLVFCCTEHQACVTVFNRLYPHWRQQQQLRDTKSVSQLKTVSVLVWIQTGCFWLLTSSDILNSGSNGPLSVCVSVRDYGGISDN